MSRKGPSANRETAREMWARCGARTHSPLDHLAAVAAGVARQALAEIIESVSRCRVADGINHHHYILL